MLLGINKVRVGVIDQERAKRFWTETLGCEVVQDESYCDERWLEVRLPDGVVLVLEKRDAINEAASPGQPNTSVFLACDDVDASYSRAGGARSHIRPEARRHALRLLVFVREQRGQQVPPHHKGLTLLQRLH
ncbi:MAG: glyoxalase [Actinomycetota bacterium]|nr:glyoxalase [Actinomycetota bacterium]